MPLQWLAHSRLEAVDQLIPLKPSGLPDGVVGTLDCNTIGVTMKQMKTLVHIRSH
jgi:hypothetical protein